jgi:hypothetical protein
MISIVGINPFHCLIIILRYLEFEDGICTSNISIENISSYKEIKIRIGK